MEYAAGASGAVLGFIHKDIPGAIAGYQIGRSLYKNLPKKKTMAPLPRTPQASSVTPKRKATFSTPRSVNPRRRLFVRKTHQTGSNVVTGASKRVGNKVKKERRRKRVKISRSFRHKVKQSLETYHGTGWFRETLAVQKMVPGDNAQVVLLPGRSVRGVFGNYFSPTDVNYVASHLYNKMARLNGNLTGNETALFPVANLKIDVIEQYYVMKFRNNSARTYDLQIIDYSPKSAHAIANSLLTSWENALANGAPFGAQGTAGQESRENVNNTLVTTMGNHPKYCATLRHYYSFDTTHVKLEAGKEYYHKVKGPNMKSYVFNKYFKDSNFHDIQAFCKGTMVLASLDLTSTSLGTDGRYTDVTPVEPQALIIETTKFTKIKCPDRAGFQTPAAALAAGTIQPISQKSDNVWSISYIPAETPQAGTVEMRVDENPLQNLTET